MSKIKRILVAIDLSEYSEKTMKYAAEIADRFEAELTIVNVINQRDVDAVSKKESLCFICHQVEEDPGCMNSFIIRSKMS